MNAICINRYIRMQKKYLNAKIVQKLLMKFTQTSRQLQITNL